MADESEIPLVVTVGDSAQQLQLLTDRIAQTFEQANKLLSAFDKLPGGAKAFGNVVAQVGLLQKALSTPTPEIGILNAATRGAQNLASAVKEIDTQKLLADTRAISNAIRSTDPGRVKEAVEANKRIIDQAKLQVAQLEQLAARAEGAEVRRLANQLSIVEARLAQAVAREQRAVARLEELQVQAGVARRQQSRVVSAAFEQTPQGQIEAARTAAAYENRDRDLQAAAAARQARQQEAATTADYRASYSLGTLENQNRDIRYGNDFALANRENADLDRKYLNDWTLAHREASDRDFKWLNDYRLATQENAARDADYRASYSLGTLENQNRNAQASNTRRAAELENQDYDIRYGNDFALANRENQDRDFRARRDQRNANADYSASYTLASRENADLDRKYLNDWTLAHREASDRDFKWLNDYRLATRENADRDAIARRQGNEQNRVSPIDRHLGVFLDYAAIGAGISVIYEATKAVLDFDAALRDFQAVTGITNAQATELGKTILAVSTNSRFSAKELADAAKEMATAGLSFKEVEAVLQSASTLSLATNSPLKESTDLLISTIDTYKANAGETEKITDQLVVTLNTSRLNVEKLSTAFQGIGVTAKESGLSFAETSSALATLSNAGLNSGQQLGQGFRQVLTSLDNPSANFKKRLDELGISLSEIDVRSNGLTGVMQNLRDHGFSAADAFEVFGSRASTAFIGLLQNVEANKSFYTAVLNSTGAAEHQSAAMDSLRGQWDRLRNTMTALTITTNSGVVHALKTTTGGLADMFGGVNANSAAWTILGNVVAGLAIAGTARYLIGLVSGLRVVRDATIAASEAWTIYNSTTGTAGAAIKVLGASLGGMAGVLLGGLGIAGVITLLASFANESAGAAKTTEELKGRENELKSALDEKGKALESVNEFLDNTIARGDHLRTSQDALNDTVLEARNRFGNLSSVLNENITSFDGLVSKVVQLRHELQSASGIDLANYISTLNKQRRDASDRVEQAASPDALANFLSQQGVLEAPTTDNFGRIINPSSLDRDPTRLLAKGVSAYGADPAATAALRFIAGQDVSTENARSVLSSLNQNAGGLPADKVEALRAAVQQIASGLVDQIVATAKLHEAGTRQQITDLQQTPGYQQAETVSVQARQTLAGGHDFSGLRDTDARQAALDILTAKVNPLLGQLDQYRASLGSDDQAAFDSTDVGASRNELRATVKKLTDGVGKFVENVAVAEAKLREQTLSREISELQQELSHDAKHGGNPAVLAQIQAKAAELRDTQYKAVDDELAKELLTAPPDSPLRSAQYRDTLARERKLQADAQYQSTINRADYTGSRGEGRRDPNPPILPDSPNYGRDLSKQLTLDDKAANDAVAQTEIPLKSQQAFIAAASQNQQFPTAVIDYRKSQLNDLKIQQATAELEIRRKQVQQLQGLITEGQADITKTQQAIDELLSVNGAAVQEDGSIRTNFSDTPQGAQERAEFVKQYNQLKTHLGTLNAFIPKATQQIEAINTKIDTINAETDVRSLSSQGDFQTAYDASLFDFNRKSGVSDSTFKQQGDAISNVFSNLDKSFATFIQNFATNSGKGKQAFGDFARSVVQNALQMASNKAASSILSYLFSLAGSALGGLSGSGGLPSSPLFASGADTAALGAGVLPGGNTGSPLYNGGIVIRKYDYGGIVPGVHIGRDSVPALLAPGEGVLNRGAVSLIGTDMVDAMNSGAIQRSKGMPTLPAPKQPDMVNVYVVDKTTPQPVPGPKDIIAAIGDDILASGQTKKLIKQVAVGTI